MTCGSIRGVILSPSGFLTTENSRPSLHWVYNQSLAQKFNECDVIAWSGEMLDGAAKMQRIFAKVRRASSCEPVMY